MNNIGDEYEKRKKMYLEAIASNLQSLLTDQLEGVSSRVERVITRVKNTERFVEKAQKEENGKRKYADPFVQIQDQIGVRIIVFYIRDIEPVKETIEGYYGHIEKKYLEPEGDSSFGYVGTHYVLTLPEHVIDDDVDKGKIPQFFELQIHTLFQHAWSEASHDLDYKPSQCLTRAQNRKVAFTAAQAWGADHMFSELANELNKNE